MHELTMSESWLDAQNLCSVNCNYFSCWCGSAGEASVRRTAIGHFQFLLCFYGSYGIYSSVPCCLLLLHWSELSSRERRGAMAAFCECLSICPVLFGAYGCAGHCTALAESCAYSVPAFPTCSAVEEAWSVLHSCCGVSATFQLENGW